MKEQFASCTRVRLSVRSTGGTVRKSLSGAGLSWAGWTKNRKRPVLSLSGSPETVGMKTWFAVASRYGCQSCPGLSPDRVHYRAQRAKNKEEIRPIRPIGPIGPIIGPIELIGPIIGPMGPTGPITRFVTGKLTRFGSLAQACALAFIQSHSLRLPARARKHWHEHCQSDWRSFKKLRGGWGNGGSAGHRKTEKRQTKQQ